MKGICFIEPLFNATIDGRKTQTRRIVTPQPEILCHLDSGPLFAGFDTMSAKPRYKKGELLYLKEPYIDDLNMDKTYFKYSPDDIKEISEWLEMPAREVKSAKKIWKNKLFMPQSAARYFIKITDVRMERLWKISEKDCKKEGVMITQRAGFFPDGLAYDISKEWDYKYASPHKSPGGSYAALIDKINGKGTWESNPFVFVYDYELMPF